jgi:hypothetical protein
MMKRLVWASGCLLLCLAGCLVPAGTLPDDAGSEPADVGGLDAIAFQAAREYDRELARVFRELADRAEAGATDAQLAQEQEAAVANARRAFAPVARAFEARVKPEGQFNAQAAANAFREIATGYESAANCLAARRSRAF